MVFLLRSFVRSLVPSISGEPQFSCFSVILEGILKTEDTRFYQMKPVFPSILLIFLYFRFECLSFEDSELYKISRRTYDELERSCKEDCMQPCDSTSYKIQYSLASLRSSFENVPEFLEPTHNVSLVYLNLFFNKFEITEMREVETLTLSSVIANVGGALGVFLGASAITLIELFMFICPYLWCILSEMFSSSVFGFLKSKRSVTVSSIASIKTTW